jgi:hypothetical protein
MSFEFKLEDFIPYYVNYDDTDTIYSLPKGDDLYNSTVMKKEFDENRLDKLEEIRPGELYKQQVFISRFLSPHTPYDRLLVYHGIGSGKCVHPETFITLEHGLYVTIEELWDLYETDIITDSSHAQWTIPSNDIVCHCLDTDKKRITISLVKYLYREHVDTHIKKYVFEDYSELTCTTSHKLYIKDKGFTSDVKVDDYVYKNTEDKIDKLKIIMIEYISYRGYVYDLTVDKYSNYVANNIVTHNTCVITAVTENALQSFPNMRQAIVLTRNPTLRNDIIGKIAGSCTNNKYAPKDIYVDSDGKTRDSITKKVVDERFIRKRVQKNVKQSYEVYTFNKFAKEIRNLSDIMLKNEFNNRIILIDEAHNIKSRVQTEDGGLNVYKLIHHFLHTVQGCKILLLTATPMKDQPSEITNVLNLLLPMDKQLDVKEFIKMYMTPSGFNRNLAQSFKDKYLRGIVSYVRSMSENINVINEGSIDKEHGMKFMKLVELGMDKFQDKYYLSTFKKEAKNLLDKNIEDIEMDVEDDKQNTLWLESRQSSMFIFPDGSYGSAGEKKYLNQKTMKVSNELEDFIMEQGNNNESKLKQLKKLSVKFYKVIKDIIKKPKEKFFVYSNIVTGGGAHLFAAILQLFDFDHIDIPNKSTNVSIKNLSKNSNRYILVTGGLLTPAQTDLLLDGIFNDRENIYGDYARIIIGSHVVGEGKSFKHVKNMYVLTSYWNTPTIDQAIGRVVRADSHTHFENPEDRFVKVYKLVAMPIEDEDDKNVVYGNSIDLMMYKVSEDKDIKIKSVERLLKESAIDCAINYKRNVSSKDKPFSKECDYMEDCNYKCDYVDPKFYEQAWIGERITDTYNLYYGTIELDRVKIVVKEAFRKKNAYDFYELYNVIRNDIKDIHVLILARALNDMIIFNDVLKNRYGFINFLREDRNLFFLVDDPLSSSIYTSYYYALNPVAESKFESFDEIIQYQQLINFDEVIDLMIEYKDEPNILNKILDNLPLQIVEKMIMIFLFAKMKKSQTNLEIQNEIINKYGSFIIEYPDSYVLNIDKNHIKKIMKNASSYDEWNELSEEDIAKSKQETLSRVDELKRNPYGYYAIIGTEHTEKDAYKNLRIVKVREVRLTQKGTVNKSVESSLRGTACGTGEYQLKGLITFYYDILKKSIELNNEVPIVPIEKQYKVSTIIKMDQFKKYLLDHIENIIKDDKLIEKLLQKSPEEITEIIKEIVDKSEDKKLKRNILIENKDVFTEKMLKDILEKLGKLKEKIFKSLNIKFTGYEGIEMEERVEEELSELNENNLNMLGNALKMKAPELCPIMQQWFIKQELYIK